MQLQHYVLTCVVCGGFQHCQHTFPCHRWLNAGNVDAYRVTGAPHQTLGLGIRPAAQVHHPPSDGRKYWLVYSCLPQGFMGMEAFEDVMPMELDDGSFLWVRRFESPAEVPDHMLVFK